MSVTDDYELVNETIEVEVKNVNVGQRLQQDLPRDVIREHDLFESIIDIVVSQGDISFAATGVVVNSDGQFTLPKRKAELYGLDRDGRMTVYIDTVEARK